jgi:hypothetical protein
MSKRLFAFHLSRSTPWNLKTRPWPIHAFDAKNWKEIDMHLYVPKPSRKIGDGKLNVFFISNILHSHSEVAQGNN